MNLIDDVWLPVVRENGIVEKIALYQIAEANNPVIDIDAPRADLRGALYQLLIGLLQTVFAPSDQGEWLNYYNRAPNAESLKTKLQAIASAFNLSFDHRPAFMQAKETFEGDLLPIEDIIGGELSGNTRLNNADLFVKTGAIKSVSPYWAAIALFNLQTSGVLAWGKHRVGMRGNGPVTTLAITEDKGTLWQNCWLNVLDKENGSLLPGDWGKKSLNDVFPWMGPTRISPKKEPTLPLDCSPLQHYWPMPRRIHLIVEDRQAVCDLSGERIERVVTSYKRIKDGVYYTGTWQHPLSPYSFNEKKDKSPKIVTGSALSYGYRDWIGLICGNNDSEPKTTPGFIVRENLYERQVENIKIWCFGYRAPQGKAQVYGYIDKQLPGFSLNDDDKYLLSQWVSSFLSIPTTFIDLIYTHIANARWGVSDSERKRNKHSMSSFKKNKELEIAYWNSTEKEFYEVLKNLLVIVKTERHVPVELKRNWIKSHQCECMKYFDQYALTDTVEVKQLKRIVVSRGGLERKIRKSPVVMRFSDGVNADIKEDK